jgi:hypothetical protein
MAKKKSTATAGNKRTLDDITAELPTKEALSRLLQPLIPVSTPPQLHLPTSLDLGSPYALFTLFISEDIFQYISRSTNEYAAQSQEDQSESESESTRRAWKDNAVNCEGL